MFPAYILFIGPIIIIIFKMNSIAAIQGGASEQVTILLRVFHFFPCFTLYLHWDWLLFGSKF